MLPLFKTLSDGLRPLDPRSLQKVPAAGSEVTLTLESPEKATRFE